MWWVPVVISAVCIAVGAGAAARWLPELAPGPVGGLAFFVVCGLLAGALDLLGLHVYSIVRELEEFRALSSGAVLGAGLESLLVESGTLFGLAGIVFLLAPRQAEPSVETQPSVEPQFH